MNQEKRLIVIKDLERYGIYHRRLALSEKYSLLFIKVINNHKEFRNLFYHRIKLSHTMLLSLFAKPFDGLYLTPFPKMVIDPGGILFQHPFSTIINAASIGYGCIFRHNTTVGNIHENLDLVPVFLNNVNVGASCVIVGKITIGNNVIIGAGTVLTKSVPDNCVVVGNPARIIRKDGKRCDIKL
ncbi:serine acetyltransferase [uncultured Dysgonomonas sp.]|uniref:serine acetyltransferase n=1 Tax=uncultured Dysgonomonas sp. TaxID=206096 RepID=UPI00260C2949|nr:serine acetyltransferase [uncultured Dysgonomonas sp.]